MDDLASDDRQGDGRADDRRGSSREDIAVKHHEVRVGADTQRPAPLIGECGVGGPVTVGGEGIGE
jgi:hypothetical protein